MRDDSFDCGKDAHDCLVEQRGKGRDTLVFERRVSDDSLCKPGKSVLPFYNYELVGLRHENCGRDPAVTACPNVVRFRAKTRSGTFSSGTECIWSAWDLKSLRWGWPENWPDGSRCPRACTHQRLDNFFAAVGRHKLYRVGCNRTGSAAPRLRAGVDFKTPSG